MSHNFLGVPLDTLLSSVQIWLNNLGCSATTVDEVLKAGPHPNLLAALQEGIERVNREAISNAQKIQKFSIIPMDFSIPTGELGKIIYEQRFLVSIVMVTQCFNWICSTSCSSKLERQFSFSF